MGTIDLPPICGQCEYEFTLTEVSLPNCPRCGHAAKTWRKQVGDVLSVHSEEEHRLWGTESFARDWFEDALREARASHDHHARRREIVFAVCFAESYLVEWVRDEALRRNFRQLSEYFPPDRPQSVIGNWRDIPKRLKSAGLISATLNLGAPFWQRWLGLVQYRDWLVHAHSGRPETSPQAAEEKPRPTKRELDSLQAGWACRVVVELVRQLHLAVGRAAPTWLVEP